MKRKNNIITGYNDVKGMFMFYVAIPRPMTDDNKFEMELTKIAAILYGEAKKEEKEIGI